MRSAGPVESLPRTECTRTRVQTQTQGRRHQGARTSRPGPAPPAPGPRSAPSGSRPALTIRPSHSQSGACGPGPPRPGACGPYFARADAGDAAHLAEEQKAVAPLLVRVLPPAQARARHASSVPAHGCCPSLQSTPSLRCILPSSSVRYRRTGRRRSPALLRPLVHRSDAVYRYQAPGAECVYGTHGLRIRPPAR